MIANVLAVNRKREKDLKERKNEELRQYAEERGVKLYEIAYAMHRSYDWLMRRIRLPMTEPQCGEIRRVIDEIVQERNGNE